ncbi:MAG TPA: hypothetical protein VE152_04075, partial [Acidimicrobiales bacterium]|nr:hypothetical protein [Acidimicrobiales bacterium]
TTLSPSAANQASGQGAVTACDRNISAGPGTSCPFAEAVFVAYHQYYRSHGPLGGTVEAYSTTTGRSYTMSCSVGDGVVACRGGTNAYVTFPVQAVAVYGG